MGFDFQVPEYEKRPTLCPSKRVVRAKPVAYAITAPNSGVAHAGVRAADLEETNRKLESDDMGQDAA
jgi:hypothetical protein